MDAPAQTTNATFRLNPYGFLFRIMWSFAATRRKQVVLFYTLQAVAMVLFASQPFALGQAINALQAGGIENMHKALWWLGALFLTVPLSWSFWGPARHIERLVAFHVYDNFVQTSYRKLTELPLAWHQDHHSGETINRMQTASLALRNFSQDQYLVIQTVLRFVFATAMLFWISALVGAATLAGLFLLGVVVVRFDKKLVVLYQQYNDGAHRLNATFFDYVSNMTTLLMLRLTALSLHSLVNAVDRLRKPFVKEVVWNEWKWFVMDFSTNLICLTTLAFYILDSFHAAGTVALGTVIMIYQYQSNLVGVVRMIGTHYGTLVQQANSMDALDNINADHARLAEHHRDVTTVSSHPVIQLQNLSLTRQRDGGAQFTISVPNLPLLPGQKIALIGASGGGKSTLLCLLRGIYQADTGTLTVGGQPSLLSDLHDITTLIPQDPEIFENTIRFNVTLGVDADDASVIRAMHRSGFAGVLAQLPRGLDTDIREKGVNLSVGQKQRLALSRGFFAAEQSAIILMDEPTSSVDLQTEEQIFSTLFNDFADKTLVASLHRLHLLPKFDRILYMENGRLIADGPPAELLTSAGPVRELYQLYQAKPDSF